LACLLKRFRFGENKKEVNQNHLKHLFCRFMVAVQKLETFETDSPLKRFNFSPFETVPSDSSLNLKRWQDALVSSFLYINPMTLYCYEKLEGK
jgi:hypothetical protein